MRCISKSDIKKNNFLFSSHCPSCLVQCISIKLCTFVLGLFLVVPNKSARICLIVFGCTPRFGKWNNVKKWPCCHIEAGESCGFIPDRLETFIRIFSLNFPEMRPLGTS